MITSHGSNIRCRCVCMAILLLLIMAEILFSVIMSGLELFPSEMPLNFGSAIHVNAVLYVCLLAPLVLLSFAGLSLLFAAYGRDERTICLSVALQAASWLLILIGLTVYLFVNLCYMSLENVASWFYAYAAVQVELAITIFLTHDTRRKISLDWEIRESLCPEKALQL